MQYSVLGANGYIGSALLEFLRQSGHQAQAFGRGQPVGQSRLGTVFYCIGVTAAFRERPLDAVEAHVSVLTQLLRQANFEQLIYLSSARVYAGAVGTGEDGSLQVQPQQLSDLYNLSKLCGESACLHSGRFCKVIRLSNVYGSEDPSSNFLAQVLRAARETGEVVFLTSPESSKDFVSLHDTVRLLMAIAERGQHKIYNLGRGRNTSNRQLAEGLENLGVKVTFAVDAPSWQVPPLDTRRLDEEFPGVRRTLLDDLPELMARKAPHL